LLINRAYASLPFCHPVKDDILKLQIGLLHLKLLNFVDDEFWIFLMYLLILIGYFIWFSALLCCFELLMHWWRIDELNRVDIKFILCGIDVFECFEELFFAESFIWWFQCLASSRKVFFFFFFDVFWCRCFSFLLNFESWFSGIIHILFFRHFDRFFGIMLTLFR
jgi:hypothetical protein